MKVPIFVGSSEVQKYPFSFPPQVAFFQEFETRKKFKMDVFNRLEGTN